MSISNDYMVSYRCDKGLKLFNILHRTAPIMKLIAFASVIPAIIYPYIFIASAVVWLLSIAINYYKWRVVYTYNYVIKEDKLTITKTFNYIKAEILADIKFKDILNLEIIQEEELENYENTNKFYCKQKHFELYIIVKAMDISFIIVVNNYFYALLQRKINQNSN